MGLRDLCTARPYDFQALYMNLAGRRITVISFLVKYNYGVFTRWLIDNMARTAITADVWPSLGKLPFLETRKVARVQVFVAPLRLESHVILSVISGPLKALQ